MLLMLALAASLPAHADWVSYQQGSDADELVAAEPVSRDGSRVKTWTLTNYAKPMTTLEGQEYSSEKMLTTVDCAVRKVGAEQAIRYTRANASGDVVSAMETPLRLVAVNAGSAEELLVSKVCR